jgi:ATP-binding cassette subfamily B protein
MKELSYLFKYFSKYKFRLSIGALFVITSNIFALYPAQYVRKAFDTAKTAIENSTLSHSELSKTLLLYGALIIGFALLKGIFMFFMRQTIIVTSRKIEYDLKNEIYQQYQRLDTAFYKRNNTGDLMARISEDVGKVRMFLGPATMYPINMISLFSLVVYTMLSINVKLTLFVLAPLPIMSISIFYISKVIHKKSEKVQAQLSTLSTHSQEAFSGIRVIQSFVNEENNSQRFNKEAELYMQKNISLAKTNALFFPFMLLLIGLSTLLTIYIGGQEAIKGNITSGNIAEFIIYVNMLTWPMASIGWVTSIIQRAAASQKRINEFLKTKPTISPSSKKATELKGDICFENVSFTYPDTGIKALDSISFIIKEGKSLGVIGKTGSGKTTITSLLCRLYDPAEGQITIGGENIKELHLPSLRKHLSIVPQDTLLFSDSISNNIAFGNDASQSEVEEAAKKAAIHENISQFPQGYDTIIGERGVTLSGGQKQRVSIARALLKDSPVLIFDDCLSALDTKTEDHILKNLKALQKQKTTLTISHRISSIKHCDHIIVLEEGKIVESGTHQQLVQTQGIYHSLHEQQLSD